MKWILFILVFSTATYAQSPFMLTGLKSYYPVVEIPSTRVDKKYRQEILDLLVQSSSQLGINTKNFSSRSLAFIISDISVGDTIALKIRLILGEDMIRPDTKQEIFALTYVSSRIFVVQDLEEDLIDNIEDLLEEFQEQYREDSDENI